MSAYCPNCSNVVEDGTKFCNNCGAAIAVSASAPPIVAAPPAGASYQPAGGAQNQYAGASLGSAAQDAPLSTGAFVVMFLVMLIPLVNLVLLLVWAFASGTNRNRQNFARASLIMMVVGFVLSIVLSIVVFSAANNYIQNMPEGSGIMDGVVDKYLGDGAFPGLQNSGDLERLMNGEMSEEEIRQLLETYGITQEQLDSLGGGALTAPAP